MHSNAGRVAELRSQAVALLQDRNLSVREIAERLGVSRQSVERWNGQAGVRPPQPKRRSLEAWPPPRRDAARRILSAAGADPGDLAEALGFARDAAPVLLATLGPDGRDPPEDVARRHRAGDDAVHPQRLRARLRAHIGRQIAVLDAALVDAPKTGIDSSKVLRDLGGLKRLLDDLGAEAGGQDGHDARNGDLCDGPARAGMPGAERAAELAAELDLDRIRADIARRYERFVSDGATA